jgi:hypothetical protein
MASGTIAFTTISDVGSGTTTGPTAINCGLNTTIRSSIVWIPGVATRASIQGCNIASTIAGPFAVAGATNTDPLFVDPAQHDYHLGAASPARDAVDTGPATDFEGDLRPQGPRFDLGADEAKE